MQWLNNPTKFKQANGWLTVTWLIAVVPIVWLLSNSVPFLVFVSVYAVVTGHLATWQAARVEERQEQEHQERDQEYFDRIERKLDDLREVMSHFR